MGVFYWESPNKVAGCYGNGVENGRLCLWAVCSSSLHVLLLENRHCVKSNALASAGKKVVPELPRKPQRSFPHLLLRLLLLLLLGLAGVAAVCHLTDMKKEAMCVPVHVAMDNGLLWAGERAGALRQLLKNLSAAAKEFLESSQASKN